MVNTRIRKDEMTINTDKLDMVKLIQELQKELDEGNTVRTHAFLDLVLSNGDVLNDLEKQLIDEQ